MPKATFYNLPNEKKQKLIEALQDEFSAYSLAKASIARIITHAGIPRGSFYQYFEDKSDAFFYLFNKQTDEAAKRLYELLQRNNGNIFKASIEFFQLIIQDDNPFPFFRHSLLNTNYQIYQSLNGIFVQEMDTDQFQQFYEEMDLSLLQLENKEQFQLFMKILSSIIFYNYREKLAEDIPIEKATAQCRFQLDLLQGGVAAPMKSV